MTSVSTILRPAAKALGWSAERFLEELVKNQRAAGMSDSYLRALPNYARKPATRCPSRFAELVRDFLHTRTAVKDRPSLQIAKRACDELLLGRGKDRYLKLIGTQPSKRSAVDKFVGTYAISRTATQDKTYRQEILVLARRGRKPPNTFATYIGHEIVSRGQWFLIGNSVCCIMSGVTSRARHDVVSIFLAGEESDDHLLGGVLAGVSSGGGLPVTMPVLATKIDNPSAIVWNIGDKGNAEVKEWFGRSGGSLSPTRDQLQIGILDAVAKIFSPIIAGPNTQADFVSVARAQLNDSKDMVVDRLQQLCRKVANPKQKT